MPLTAIKQDFIDDLTYMFEEKGLPAPDDLAKLSMQDLEKLINLIEEYKNA